VVSERILVVDDDSLIRKSLFETLSFEGYEVITASDGAEALVKMEQEPVNVAITDIKMPNMDGLQFLKEVKAKYPDTSVILVTGYGSIETAVDAMRMGAADYVTKPILDSEIKITIRKIFDRQKLVKENEDLRKQLTLRYQFHNLVGQDHKMQQIYDIIETIAESDVTILIRGESGTGKRLIAKAIHFNSLRKDKPFIEVSCGALPASLLESELFGHIRGAFTTAIRDRMGRFELANGGTILLDDIDCFTTDLQVKLLRVLQEREFERVGSTKTLKADVRIIAATNRDLEEAIRKKAFREDLYYRVNVVSIEIPPLRDRVKDIPILCEHFLSKSCESTGKRIRKINEKAMELMMKYPWPGNVRELENAIERAVILAKTNEMMPEDLPEPLMAMKETVKFQIRPGNGSLKEALKIPEKQVILNALAQNNWNRKKVAQMLEINRTTLYNKMKEYGLMKERSQPSGK
jgi:DNA-binding NtrC family response regulator